MPETEFGPALQKQVVEWQKKHGVNDNDPILATLELLEIYFRYRQPPPSQSAATFEEFRGSLEELDRHARKFNSQSTELIRELRTIPEMKKRFASYRAITVFVIALLALIAGVLVGKFLL